MQKRVRQVQEQVAIQSATQGEQQLCITCSKVTGDNWKTFEYTVTGRVQKLGSGAIRAIEVFKAILNKKHCRPYCHWDKQELEAT
jgi:DNA-directed RNA polymerase subunit N (RpoN/RPB10)